MNNLQLAIIDVETTGISAVRDRIIEVAVLRISEGELTEQSSTLVNPERPIPRYIERLTGITNEELRGAPPFREIKDDLLRQLEGSILVAHNARFDYGFIRKEFERERIAFSAKCLCTVRLSRRLFPGLPQAQPGQYHHAVRPRLRESPPRNRRRPGVVGLLADSQDKDGRGNAERGARDARRDAGPSRPRRRPDRLRVVRVRLTGREKPYCPREDPVFTHPFKR